MAKFGLAVDNVIAIELVTAEGRVLTASDREEPDLFWGLRGGGGNFGVAASFTYRLHPLTPVVGGLVAHPLSAAGDLLRFYRDVTASLSDLLSGARHEHPNGESRAVGGEQSRERWG